MSTYHKSVMNTQEKILKYLLENSVSSADMLSKEFEVSRQTVCYHLGNLVKSGYVITVKHDQKTYFVPQQCLIDEKAIGDICKSLKPIIESVSSYVDLSQTQNPKDALKSLILFFIDYVLDDSQLPRPKERGMS